MSGLSIRGDASAGQAPRELHRVPRVEVLLACEKTQNTPHHRDAVRPNDTVLADTKVVNITDQLPLGFTTIFTVVEQKENRGKS